VEQHEFPSNALFILTLCSGKENYEQNIVTLSYRGYEECLYQRDCRRDDLGSDEIVFLNLN
jgi:hypothetical protein